LPLLKFQPSYIALLLLQSIVTATNHCYMYTVSVNSTLLKYCHKLQRWKLLTKGLTRLH